MSNSNCDRLIQLTNATVGAVATATLLPVGIMTRRIMRSSDCEPTFLVATSANNSVYIQEEGFYKITYVGYLTAAAAGNIVVQLQINGVTQQTATVTATAAGTFPVILTFVTRVLPNCCSNSTNTPVLVQLNNNGVALTGGTSNLLIERISTAN